MPRVPTTHEILREARTILELRNLRAGYAVLFYKSNLNKACALGGHFLKRHKENLNMPRHLTATFKTHCIGIHHSSSNAREFCSDLWKRLEKSAVHHDVECGIFGNFVDSSKYKKRRAVSSAEEAVEERFNLFHRSKPISCCSSGRPGKCSFFRWQVGEDRLPLVVRNISSEGVKGCAF